MDSVQIVAFRLNENLFAIDIMKVKEIMKIQPVTKLPVSDSSILGVINVRGTVIPVIDTRVKLGIERTAVSDDSRLLLVEKCGIPMGLMVDEVTEVLTINQEQIERTEEIGMNLEYGGGIIGIAKIDDKLLTFLNTDTLL